MKSRRLARIVPLVLLLAVFSALGVASLDRSQAASAQLPAAQHPREALGVSGTPSTLFARWLDREDVNRGINFGITLAHFNPSSITTQITGAANNDTSEKTTIVTINPVPERGLTFLPDRSKPAGLCGTFGSTNNGAQSDYQDISNTFNYNGNSIQLARGNLGNANQDQDNDDVRDNIQNLYRATQGCYDLTYQLIADRIVQSGAHESYGNGRPKLVIRFGHEHNGGHFEWSSNDQTDDNSSKALALTGGKNGNQLYKETWQHAVGLIESRVRDSVPDANIVFEFNTTFKALTGGTAYHEATYPGDQYVEVFGLSFYDRAGAFGNPDNQPNKECYRVTSNEYVVPDCRSDAAKEQAWGSYDNVFENITELADRHNKLVGFSEHAVSTKVENKDGTLYWTEGGDNDTFYEGFYRNLEMLVDKNRLGYYFIWDRNGTSGGVRNPGFDSTGYKSVHRMTPGLSNVYSSTTTPNNEVPCALELDFRQYDSSGNVISGPDQTIGSRFPKSARKFLELWAGPKAGGPSDHPQCRAIQDGVVVPPPADEEVTVEAESGMLDDPATIENDSDASEFRFLEF